MDTGLSKYSTLGKLVIQRLWDQCQLQESLKGTERTRTVLNT